MQNETSNFTSETYEELVKLEQLSATLSNTDNLKDILLRVTALQRSVYKELDRRKLQSVANA